MPDQDDNKPSKNNRPASRGGRASSNANRRAARNDQTNSGENQATTEREERTPAREEGFSITRTGDRLLEAARRNPEALVILAAGAAMLLRRGSGGITVGNRGVGGRRGSEDGETERDGDRAGLVGAAGAAGEYVTDAAGRVVDTAGEYVSTLGEYADDGRRTVTRGISRLSRRASRMGSRVQESAERMLQGQPVAVAAFGLATGAVVAAVLPRSEVEQRTLLPAREALAEAASRAVETVKETAERRFSADGLRDLAGDAAKIVTQTVLGKQSETSDSDDRRA